MNRNKALSLLLFAAAFALAVVTVHVQAGSIFLPLIARPSTGEETPTPEPSGTLRVDNVYCHERRKCFYGELFNETGCNISAPGVVVTLLDTDGHRVATVTGHSMVPTLLAGEHTPFRACWSKPVPAWDSYLVHPEWNWTERLPVECGFAPVSHSAGFLVVITATNTLPVEIPQLVVGAVLYERSGEVAGYRYLSQSHEPLAPGETCVTSQNVMHWIWDWGSNPVRCEAFSVLSGYTPSPYD